MFKRIFLLFAILLLTTSCIMPLGTPMGAVFTRVTTPEDFSGFNVNSKNYVILGETTGSSSITSILGVLALGDGGIDNAYKNALMKYPKADFLTEVRIDRQTTSVLGVVTKSYTILKGKAVKITNTE